MKSILNIFLLGIVVILSVSCFNKKEPNYQFMPNMYEPVSYETYSESKAFVRGGVEAQIPPQNTVRRGFIPYDLPNSTEGYNASKNVTSVPADFSSYNEEKAKELYTIYCAICHGEQGDGKGKLVEREKFLGVPNYKDRAISVGSVYHVQTYGLNSMGSYANQLSQQERWMVAQYVLKLKSGL
jgi:mono/diheme cytochrome c family protein